MDDDEDIQTLFAINLAKLGFDAIFANDGVEAIAIFRDSLKTNQAIDLVILDLSIPGGMGGKEAAEKILAIDPKAKLIVSSGNAYGPEMLNYSDYGFKAVFEKNFNLEEMRKVFSEVILYDGA